MSVRPSIGDLAVCQSGKLGIVKRITAQGNGRILYQGTRLSDGGPWQSVRPVRFATPSSDDFIETEQ